MVENSQIESSIAEIRKRNGKVTNFDKKSKSTEIKEAIEKFCVLTSSFKPTIHVPVCGNCGFKGEKLLDKCPTCKSQYIL